ncbi:MAG: hypothetical protein AMJ65_14060 [Phycisphaerae bacterium SG8_4]|nr:MAG: hypothetical protein AMJ65_14060 [Phycisphaerae bacterium SG8_4]
MKKTTAIILTSVCLIVPVVAQQSGRDDLSPQPRVRFAPVHIYLDSGDRSLAAYQFELSATAGQIEIVGVEAGEHKAFAEPPYYDPAALTQDRIIIAAFNTGQNLPKGRTRIVTIHLLIKGDVEPQYKLKLAVAGDADGKEIPAKITFEKGEEK